MTQPLPAPRPPMGAVNWIGLWTLFLREVRRFTKVHFQTIGAPVVTALLFLAIFALAMGRAVTEVNGVPFMTFLAPGLIMMTVAQNAFANTSSSVIISKVQGNIVDVLLPPLTPVELALGLALGGVVRGLAVGLAVAVAMAFFVDMGIHHMGWILFHGLMASMMLSLLGLIGGIWADKFDHMAAVTNFIITPLSFLSGTFYSVERLPETFRALAHANPFFYMIDGFRYGFIGQSDAPLALGAAVLIGVNLVLWLTVHRMISTGYKLKT
ncbi:ABC transporter permease [Magnetospira sp. QH-2]|uniref:ABC transporter permease n=1 Tax=Magnetospira sp. (strain QH-2) TaxID=1288970 RepID=UPI0003E80CFA|nr:ABC transporter permease [Magnetospira sp. QH-2]CCQ72360.1 ABC-2 type transporter [Magnetospira sp. QH-2]